MVAAVVIVGGYVGAVAGYAVGLAVAMQLEGAEQQLGALVAGGVIGATAGVWTTVQVIT